MHAAYGTVQRSLLVRFKACSNSNSNSNSNSKIRNFQPSSDFFQKACGGIFKQTLGRGSEGPSNYNAAPWRIHLDSFKFSHNLGVF